MYNAESVGDVAGDDVDDGDWTFTLNSSGEPDCEAGLD